MEYSKELREMFINMSTNRDLRRIMEYYDEFNLNKNELVIDFYELMEKITTEEIAERLSIDLFINFEGIEITNKKLYSLLCTNDNVKDVQVNFMAQKMPFNATMINIFLRNDIITSETFNLIIHNCDNDNRISELPIGSSKYLLDKESTFKLMKMADEYNKDFYVLIAANTKGLTSDEIDEILNAMEVGGMQMENVAGEGLLSQKSITKEQIEKIAFWDEYPTAMIFEMCWKRGYYNEKEVFDFYKHGDEEIAKVIFNSKNVPQAIINDAYLYGNNSQRILVFAYSSKDKEYQNNLLLMQEDSILPEEEKYLSERIKEDARLFLSIATCTNKNVLKAAYEAVDIFFKNTDDKNVYDHRKHLVRVLAINSSIGNDMIFKIINENSDAFSHDELEEIRDRVIMNMSPEEEKIIEQFLEEQNENLDDYLLSLQEETHRKYNDQYFEDNFDDR